MVAPMGLINSMMFTFYQKNAPTELYDVLIFVVINVYCNKITDNPTVPQGRPYGRNVFFEMSPNTRLSNLMRDLKSTSSKWINDNKLVAGKFNWQAGYAAFSYSRSQRNHVIQYIMGQ